MNFSGDDLKDAYKWLKRDNYYDTINLFLREKIAEFESNENFESKLEEIGKEINEIVDIDSSYFKGLLDKITFRLLPKKAARKTQWQNENDEEKSKNKFLKQFLSNLRTDDNYYLESINYFIDGPIEIYLISMLWCWKVGKYLDEQLADDCLGYRISNSKGKPFSLFQYYLPLYNKWRDNAINVGLSNLENNNDILLIAMDIKECFYNLECDWKNIYSFMEQNDLNDFRLLTQLLQEINQTYYSKVLPNLEKTHFNDVERYSGDEYPKNVIPIGLPSSGILANWELRKLDQEIIKKLRPVYFGRYVDDILLVINKPYKEFLKQEDPEKVFEEYFENTDILEKKNGYLKIKSYEFLYIQTSKLILHYYEHTSSWAGLTKFKKELLKQASEFRFLPENFQLKELSDDAYDIEYEGSINKLRNVIGVKENSQKLVTYLFDQQLRRWLTKKSLSEKAISQLFRFYKGVNILNHYRTWERVFSLFIGDSNIDDFAEFLNETSSLIKKLSFEKDESLNHKIQNDIHDYLNISASIAVGLLEQGLEIPEKKINKSIQNAGKKFRKTHLIRHQFVCWPLLEYSEYQGSLIQFNIDFLNVTKPNYSFSYAPRFIHFEEYQLFLLYTEGLEAGIYITLKDSFDKYHYDFLEINELDIKPNINFSDSEELMPTESGITNSQVGFRKILFTNQLEDKGKFRIGICNIKISKENISANLMPPRKSIAGVELQNDIFHMLNEAERNPKCDMIVFPEVSIPFYFIPFMANQARRKNIGIVFGAEHIEVDNICYNFVVVILPIKTSSDHQSCIISIRNKNHYSPSEELIIKNYDMQIPKRRDLYLLYKWRGCIFTVYNCFELTDIVHRSRGRSKIDLLVGISWNKDTNYYSNILESTARDIHCYVANVNTSQYGDSRILAPKRTEEQNIVQISGGENCVLLKGSIDFQALRDFQKHSYNANDHSFKPTPAGFDHDYVRKNRL